MLSQRSHTRFTELLCSTLNFGEPESFSFSPAEDLLALVQGFDTLSIHELASGKQLCTHTASAISGLDNAITPSWTPDGCLVATAFLTGGFNSFLAVLNTSTRSAAEREVGDQALLVLLTPAAKLQVPDASSVVQLADDVASLSWSPSLPGQPGTSLLAVQLGDQPDGLTNVLDASLQTLWSFAHLPSCIAWACDRSVAVLVCSGPPVGHLELWSPGGAPHTAAEQRTHDAATWLKRHRLPVVDCAWGRESSLAVLAFSMTGRLAVSVWQHGRSSMQRDAPKDCAALEWSPSGEQLLMRSQTELVVLCAVTGVSLLHYSLDQTQSGRCAPKSLAELASTGPEGLWSCRHTVDRFAAQWCPVHPGILAVSEGLRLSIVLLDGTVAFRQRMPDETAKQSISWGCAGDTVTFTGHSSLHVVAFGGPAGGWASQLVQAVRELTK